MYDGPRYRDQLRKLVPRFKAGFRTLEVFHFDHRQSTTSITRTVSETTGLKRSSTSTIWSKTTYKQSMEVSLGVAIDIFNIGLKVSAEFTVELERSFSETSEKLWSKT